MSKLADELTALVSRLEQADPEERLELHPRFQSLVDQALLLHQPISEDARRLSEELQIEAMEARFDNLPV